MRKFSLRGEQVSSVDVAADYARRLIEAEARGPGDVENAMRRLEAKTGINYWSFWGLRYDRRKTVTADLFGKLRGAYLAACERQLSKLRHELAIEQARCPDDDFADLVAEAESLAERVRLAKAKRQGLTLPDAPERGGP